MHPTPSQNIKREYRKNKKERAVMEMMTAEQFEKLKSEEQIKTIADNMEKAKDDNTPYLAIVDDEVNVLGDPNKTERKPTTYRIRFCFPRTDAWREYVGEENILEETRDYIVTRRVYKDVIVPVSRHSSIVVAFAELESFFKIIRENGTVENMSNEQLKEVAKHFDEDVRAVAYKVISSLLGIPQEEAIHMHPVDVMYAVAMLAANTEELPNEGDAFLK